MHGTAWTGDLVADERTTFDSSGGSFDIAVGRSGARYEVYSATLNNRRVGVLSVALDTNGDYVRDSSTTFDLERDLTAWGVRVEAWVRRVAKVPANGPAPEQE